MKRTAVNPWNWSLKLGYNQAEIIEGQTRQLIVAGQIAVDENGAPQHAGDMRAQIALAFSPTSFSAHFLGVARGGKP